jgi:hypothetical protein
MKGTMDGAMDGSGSNKKNDGWCKRWMDKGALEGAMDGSEN